MKDIQTPITIENEDTFKIIFSKYGAYGLEKQENLAKIVEDLVGDLDIDKGVLSFNDDIKFNVQILGFHSEEFNQWSWAWDNENIGFNESLIKESKEIKELGEKFSIDEFTTSTFEIDYDDCHVIAMMVTSIMGDSAYYAASVGDLNVFVTINSDSIPENNSSEDFRMIYNHFQKNFDIFPKLAFEGYTKLKGYFFKEREDFSLAKIGEDRVIVGFTDRNNVTNIQLLTTD